MEWLNTFWLVYSNLILGIGINALLALSIWLTLSCGLLAMANDAFMGIGAYASALLTMNAGASFPVALVRARSLISFPRGSGIEVSTCNGSRNDPAGPPSSVSIGAAAAGEA